MQPINLSTGYQPEGIFAVSSDGGVRTHIVQSTHGISVVTKPFIHVTVCPDRGTRTPNLVDISHLRQPLRHIGKIAEGEGFEPTGHERDHSFPGCPNRPLWQPSIWSTYAESNCRLVRTKDVFYRLNYKCISKSRAHNWDRTNFCALRVHYPLPSRRCRLFVFFYSFSIVLVYPQNGAKKSLGDMWDSNPSLQVPQTCVLTVNTNITISRPVPLTSCGERRCRSPALSDPLVFKTRLHAGAIRSPNCGEQSIRNSSIINAPFA